VRYPNVYGIDMPTPGELVAHGRSVEEIREVIGCDALIYQDVDSMKRAVGSLNGKLAGFDASCFDGVYITGDVTAETIAAMNSQRADTAEKIGEDSDVDASRLALPNPQEA
jgi:amidophosphoribosyltransferase